MLGHIVSYLWKSVQYALLHSGPMRYVHIAQLRTEQNAEAAELWSIHNPDSLKSISEQKEKEKKEKNLISGNNELHKPI